jgi:predicted homoserine dehydrogenase-like protein
MNLHRLLAARAAAGKPIRVGLIGAGKFGSMFLAQLLHTPGMDLAWIADLSRVRARAALDAAGWPAGRADGVRLGEYAAELLGEERPEVVVEATGDPAAGRPMSSPGLSWPPRRPRPVSSIPWPMATSRP